MRWKPRGWTLVCALLAMPGVLAMITVATVAQVVTGVPIATTQVADTIYRADGTAATGTVIVSWGAFTTPTGQTVPGGSSAATIAAGGVLSVQLAANAGATPMGSYYTAVYHLDDGTVSREYWVVPVSQSAVKLSAIRSTVLPTSVAMQTVSKAYVDTAITAAVTGHPLSSSSPYVLVAGDVMTGPLVLPGDPTTTLQAADKHYVDTSVTSLTSGLAQKVSTVPAATQVVSQPMGTQLQVNNLNGAKYASQYVNGRGDNGIANTVTSTDCVNGCEVKVERSYNSSETYLPQTWNSTPSGGTHVEDTRGGVRRDSYLNPVDPVVGGLDEGQAIDVVSTQSTAAIFQQRQAADIFSNGLTITHEGLTGGSNLYPEGIDANIPYFKTTYSALSTTGTYNTPGQHVLSPNTINCYGVGDCLIGSQFLTASGGFRDNADEGAHPFDLQIQEDTKVYQGTCSAGCTAGSTTVMLATTSGPGTQGEGRFLIDKNPARVLTTGVLTGSAAGAAGAGATFSGTAFGVSVFMSTGQAIQSQSNNIAPGTVTFAVAVSGIAAGYATNTAALPSSNGVACVVDVPNAYAAVNYEMTNYTVVDGTHLQMTLNKPHAAGATVAVGGLCGYGLEQTVDTVSGIRQVFPVIGSFSPTGLYYAGASTPIVGRTGQTSAYVNISLPVAAIVRSGNVVTVTTAGSTPADLSGLTMTVAGVADPSYNGTYAVTATGRNTLTYAGTGANSTSTGGSISLITGGYALYPMAEVLGVFDTSTKSIDGQMTLAPNTVQWALNDAVEQPHYFQEAITADMEFVRQTTPRPSLTIHAGIQYEGNMGPGMHGWTISNAAPVSNYFGHGGSHSVPDTAYEATGVWLRTMVAQVGEQAAFALHCNSHGCGSWNSGYDLFELDSNVGVDTMFFQPVTSALSLTMRGTSYSFTPQAFTASTVNATTVNATTVNATTVNATTISGAVSAAQLPLFGGSGSGHAPGAVPDPGAVAGATRYLREDGTWSAPASGGGTLRTGFVTNGLLASYPLNDGSGTAPADESGNGNNAAFCGGTQTPVWTGQGLLLNAAVAACFTVPPSIGTSAGGSTSGYTNVRTIEVTYSTKAPYSGNGELQSQSYPCYVCSTNGSGFIMLSLGANGAAPNLYTGSTSLNTTGVGSHTMVVTFDGVMDHWYVDGREAGYSSQGNSLGAITNGANNPLWVVGGSPAFSDAFQGTFHYVRFLNRALSASEAGQDSAAMQAIVAQRGVKFGPQVTPNDANVWIAHGDSRTVGVPTGIPYATYLNSFTSAAYQVTALGMSGFTAQGLRRYTATYDCYLWSPTSAQSIASIWEGTNDIAGGSGSNASAVWSYVANDAKTFRNCGFTSIVANDPSRVSNDAAEQVYNAYWRGLWQPYADGFVDLGADPFIGGTNAYSNPTYYADGVHFTVAGYTLVAQKFAREANYLKGSTLQNCTKVVTAGYTLVDADGCTKFNAAGGSFTTTLYDANDFTGRTVYVQNAATSGANTVTIAAASGQTIDGAASITIPNGTMRVLQIVYNGTAGGGDSWHVLQ